VRGDVHELEQVEAACGSRSDVRVEDLCWSEAPHAAAVLPGERRYVLRTDDDGTRVTFGLGARLPAAHDDVRAHYRSGIGAVGNARAGQISVLASRPNGVTGVTNPLPPSSRLFRRSTIARRPCSGGTGDDRLGFCMTQRPSQGSGTWADRCW
jgi:hypothetical protein